MVVPQITRLECQQQHVIGCKRPCWNEFRRGVVLRHHNLRETLQSSSNCSEMRAAVLFVFCASLSDPTTSVTSCGQDRLLIQNHNISHLCRFHLDCCPEQHQYHQKGTESIARIPGVSEALTPLPPNFPTGQLQHFWSKLIPPPISIHKLCITRLKDFLIYQGQKGKAIRFSQTSLAIAIGPETSQSCTWSIIEKLWCCCLNVATTGTK